MGNTGASIRQIPEHILRFQSPDLTLVEFEQIYDEYIQLCDNSQSQLDQERIFVHLLQNSIFLNQEEKQAIINEDLEAYIATKQAESQVFDQANEKPLSEDSKEQEAGAPRLIQESASIDRDWQELAGNNDAQNKLLQFEAPQSFDRLNSGNDRSQSSGQESGVGSSSFFCGCGGGQTGVNQSQFVTYQRPLNRRGNELSERQINVSYIPDPHAQAGCSLGGQASDAQTVYLSFKDFSSLVTWKLLNQLQLMEADTVVEGVTQNVTCFLWPGERAYQQVASISEPKYQLSEFRQSVPLQKMQSQARSLVPISETEAENEETLQKSMSIEPKSIVSVE